MSTNARQLTLKAGFIFYEVKSVKRRGHPTVKYYVPKQVMKVVEEIEVVSRARRRKNRVSRGKSNNDKSGAYKQYSRRWY